MTPMHITYAILGISTIYLIATFFSYRSAKKNNRPFTYKPLWLIAFFILFCVTLYGAATGKPYNEVVSFIK